MLLVTLCYTYLDRFSIISGDLFRLSFADFESFSSTKASFDMPGNKSIHTPTYPNYFNITAATEWQRERGGERWGGGERVSI